MIVIWLDHLNYEQREKGTSETQDDEASPPPKNPHGRDTKRS